MSIVPFIDSEKIKTGIADFFKPTGELRTRDVLRELPGALKEESTKLAEKELKFLKESGQSELRILGGVGNIFVSGMNKLNAPIRGALGQLSKIDALAPLDELREKLEIQQLTPQTQFQKEIFGTDKTLSLTRAAKELRGAFVDKEPEELRTLPIDPILGGLIGISSIVTPGKQKFVQFLNKDLFNRVAAKYGTTIAKQIDELRDVDFATGSLVRGSEETVAQQLNLSPLRFTVRKLTDSINNFQKTYIKTKELRAVERAERFGEAKKALEAGQGESAFRSALSKLEGELPQAVPKPSFVTDNEVRLLFDSLKSTPGLTTGEKMTGFRALGKTIGDPFYGGKLPAQHEIDILRKAFGDDLANSLLESKTGVRDLIEDLAGLPRALMASMDFSAPLRQGLFLMVDNPKQFVNAFTEQYKYFFRPKYFEAAMDNLKNSPMHRVRLNSGLDLPEPYETATKLTQREEAFRTDIVQRLPGIRDVVNASERAYVGFLNKLRADIFDGGAKQLMSTDMDENKLTTELRGLANFINHASGRGHLPGKFGQAGSLLGSAFFSSRLLASRFQLMNPQYYYSLPPFARKAAIRSGAKTIGFLSSMAALAKGMGADVETDSRSSDFGKIKVDNIRYDIYGGFQQWAVLYSRIISGTTKTLSGDVKPLSKEVFPFQTPLDTIETFFENKAAPIPALAMDLIRRATPIGEDLTFMNTVGNKMMPFVIQDFMDIMEEEGLIDATLKVIPVLHGVGVQVIQPKRKNKEASFGSFNLPALKL